MFISKTVQESHIKAQKKPKRVEWLNIYSKGFIVESINNNYINQNISIKKLERRTKNNKNIILRNINPIMSKRAIKLNKSILGYSGLSSRKTNFSYMIDDDEDYNSQKMSIITQLNHLFSNTNKNETEYKKNDNNKNVKNINNSNKNKNKLKNNKTDKNKGSKLIKCNSSKNIKIMNEEKNVIMKKINKNIKNHKNRCRSLRSKVNLSLKHNISSPLINYLEFRFQNINHSYFNSKTNNNKDNDNQNNNTIVNRNNDIQQLKTVKCEKKNYNINNDNDFTIVNNTTYNIINDNNKTYNNINNNGNNCKSEIKKKKKNFYRYSKSIKEITINNVNIIEIQKYMIDGRKYKHYKNQNKNNNLFNDYKNDIRDYTFDNDDEDEDNKLAITERKNIMSFSELCTPSDLYMTNKKATNKFYV